MLPQDIKRIMEKNEKYAEMLEEYDRTGKLPIEKIRRSFTLRRMTVSRLRRLARERHMSMSDLIDELVASQRG